MIKIDKTRLPMNMKKMRSKAKTDKNIPLIDCNDATNEHAKKVEKLDFSHTNTDRVLIHV